MFGKKRSNCSDLFLIIPGLKKKTYNSVNQKLYDITGESEIFGDFLRNYNKSQN